MKAQTRFGIALAGVICFASLSYARADEFSDRIAKAISTLNQIDKHIDSVKERVASGGGSSAVAEASTVKCDACGMVMTMTRKAGQRAVKIGGKTYYCCRGCDMSKQVDK